MVELVVVIAVIAVLAAMVLPPLLSTESNKVRVTDAAKDYYVAVQHVMSKFAKYESDVAKPGVAVNNGAFVVKYDKEFGGNRPIYEYIFISMEIRNSRILHAAAYSSDSPEVAMAQVLQGNNRIERELVENGTYDLWNSDGDDATVTPEGYRFLSMFMDEMNALFDAADGFYYALIRYDGKLETNAAGYPDASAGNSVMRVAMAGYGDYALPYYSDTVTATTAPGFEAYKTKNLLVTELGKISTGDYFGIQSSEKVGSYYIGESGSYFAVN